MQTKGWLFTQFSFRHFTSKETFELSQSPRIFMSELKVSIIYYWRHKQDDYLVRDGVLQ